jgi:[ribosomal protein S18]-alanine N-acetyltransferase
MACSFFPMSKQKSRAYNSSMSDPPLRIRDFHSGDIEQLYAIDSICFPEDIAFSRMELLGCCNHGGTLCRIAEAHDGIQGFVLARIEELRQAHIITLDVVPQARRRGIGSALMDKIHGILRERGVRASILEVDMANIPARRLYEKFQYRYLDVLNGYYCSGKGARLKRNKRAGEGQGESETSCSYPIVSGDAFRMLLKF